LFGKDFKDDVKITKMEDAKEGDANIIGSSDDNGKKDSKGNPKFVEGTDEKQDNTKTTKKKKKKKKKKVQDDQVDVLDNQYEGDELAQDAPNTLNKT